MTRGRLVAVVGPSGAGKDTLIDGARAARPDLATVRWVIPRAAAAGGEDFEGVSAEEFGRRRAAGEFAVSWQAHGLSYGIPNAEVEPLFAGRDVVFNGSRAALETARAVFPDLRVILVTAPPEVLAARLASRGRETEADIAARLGRASFDLPQGIKAVTVLNDGAVETGVARFLAALQADRG